MDKIIRLLESQNIVTYYSNTDSVIYALKHGQINPLNEGNCFDQFKNELPNCTITSFHSLGPKVYQLSFQDNKDLSFHTITKLKGFYLSSQKAKQVVHDTIFKEFVEGYLQGVDMEVKLAQWNIKATKKRHLKSIIMQKV